MTKTLWNRRKFFGVFIFLITIPLQILATQDSVRYGGLPMFSFDSDNGLYVALELQRFQYTPEVQPYRNFSKYNISFRTSGSFSLYGAWDELQTFGSRIRTWTDVYVNRNLGNYHPGDSFNHPFSREKWDDGLYNFESVTMNIGTTLRIPVSGIRGIIRDDVKLGLRWVYEKPTELEPGSLMLETKPIGWNGSTYILAETGFIRERRDSELVPSTGIFYGFTVRSAVPGLSHTNTTIATSDFRWYVPLYQTDSVFELIFAQKIVSEYALGSPPYWLKPSLGGGGGLRGYEWRRFNAHGTALIQTEVRTMLVQLPWWDIRLGMNLFLDTGLVFNQQLTQSKTAYSWGFAGMMSVRNSDYFVKYEMGFSEDGMGIYIGSGYSF